MNTGQITADTALPSLRAYQCHHPQTRAGVVVTMPGPDDTPLVFPALCGGAYARQPRAGDPTELSVCASCAELRAAQHMPAA